MVLSILSMGKVPPTYSPLSPTQWGAPWMKMGVHMIKEWHVVGSIDSPKGNRHHDIGCVTLKTLIAWSFKIVMWTFNAIEVNISKELHLFNIHQKLHYY